MAAADHVILPDAAILLVGAVLLGAAALGPAAARADYLSSSELRRLFPGQFEAVWKDKINLSLDAAANGHGTERAGH